MSDEISALESAFLQKTVTEETKMAVKAEDIETGSSLNFEEHFFEPQPGHTYQIKFLPNPGGEALTHRGMYGKLPDPTRKGKTFKYISSGDASTCLALELFFDLNKLKKDGDDLAEKKIKKYMGKTNQAGAKIQILKSSDEKYKTGDIRIFGFSTFGQNAHIANLVDQKLNPTPAMIEDGEIKEDIFDIFESSILNIECNEADFDGQKGREYSKSSWLKTKKGAIGIIFDEEDGKIKEAKQFDASCRNDDGSVKEEIIPFFRAFVKHAMNTKYCIHNMFAYKKPGDAKNSDETEKYIKSVFKKVEEIIPIIRDAKSIDEIANYGKADTSSSSNTEKPDNAKNVMAEAVPEELAGSVLDKAGEVEGEKPSTDKPVEEKTGSDTVTDILNS